MSSVLSIGLQDELHCWKSSLRTSEKKLKQNLLAQKFRSNEQFHYSLLIYVRANLFKFNRSWRLRRAIVQYAIDAFNFIDDSVSNFV